MRLNAVSLDKQQTYANSADVIKPRIENLLLAIDSLKDSASSSLYAYTRNFLDYYKSDDDKESGWGRLMQSCCKISAPEGRGKALSCLATLGYHRPEKRLDALKTIVEAVKTQKPYVNESLVFGDILTRFEINFHSLVKNLPHHQQSDAEAYIKSILPKCIYYVDATQYKITDSIDFANSYYEK